MSDGPPPLPLGLRRTVQPDPGLRALSTFGVGLDDDDPDAPLLLPDPEPADPDVPEEGTLLGAGATSEVRLGYQRSLGRPVALKRLRPERRSVAATASLLREARISALLEHPNIVPVHDASVDAAGVASVTLRRVTGDVWTVFLEDPIREAQVVGAGDPLEWHLRVLLQVGNAVRFAHRHGVVHRDLKPDNVMIGAYGEVYLVDWGIAVATGPTGPRFLPQGDHQPWMAGTPAYMAPEQLGEGAPVTERTDVFLLGALLFSVLTRRPPYVGPVDAALLDHIRRADPVVPLDGPPGLVAVCRHAMARAPEDRPASAEQLLEGVERWLRERGAEALVREAREQLASLLGRVAAGAPESARFDLYGLYGQCRFGFDQALRIEPGRADAVEGRRAAVGAMVRYELDRGDADAAAVLLVEMAPPDPVLGTRLARLRAEVAAEAARNARLLQDHDPGVRRSTRLVAVGALLLLWTLLPIAGVPVQAVVFGGPSWTELALIDATFSGIVLVGALLSYRSWATTSFNRWLVGGVAIAIGGQGALDFGSWLAGIPVATAHALHLFLWASVVGYGSLVLDRRMALPAVGFGLGWWVAARWPAMTYPVFSVTNALLLGVVVWMWGRPGPDAVPSRDAPRPPPDRDPLRP